MSKKLPLESLRVVSQEVAAVSHHALEAAGFTQEEVDGFVKVGWLLPLMDFAGYSVHSWSLLDAVPQSDIPVRIVDHTVANNRLG